MSDGEAGGMEARNVRPFGLRVLRGGRQDRSVSDDEESERRIVERVAAQLRQAISELPAASSWRLPFERFWRAVREGLRRGR